jgi:uncharacterized membrane protein
MLTIFKLTIAVLVLGYPFLVYFGLTYFDARGLALALIVLAAARLAVLGKDQRASPLLWVLLLSFTAVGLIGLLVLVSGSPDHLRFYPVAVNAAMLLLFGVTLLRPPSMIERLARLREPQLPPGAVRYTRVVTEVWCGFFLLNGGGALYTALFADLAAWTLYNGMISYLLVALLFAGEILVRRRVQRGSQAPVNAR